MSEAPNRERDGWLALAGCLLLIGAATLVALLIWIALRA